jgi:hypothetical protein
MRKCKERFGEAKYWHTIYLVVSVSTKPPLVHVVEAHHTRVFLPGHQVSPKRTTWLATKARHEGTCQASLVPLMSHPLRSFFTKEGVSTSLTQSVLVAPHQVRGLNMIASEPLRTQGFWRTLYSLIHSRITYQSGHTLHSLSSKISLALSTHS